ncbi:MAG: FKBP-type peptidyl-prolyl cis-trans isomerase [Sphingobacterium sp.]
MKTLFKPFLLLALTVLALASCSKSDDYDYEKAQEEARIQDSLNNVRIQKVLTEQAGDLEQFAKTNFETPVHHDSLGIWYDVVNPGEADPFSYIISGGRVVSPKITVIYKGTLLDGTVFDESDDKDTADKVETREFDLSRMIKAWQSAFLPKVVNYNGYSIPMAGLTTEGLRKGSVIKFVTPSPWAYDAKELEKIPANSPLYFEMEVVDISYE